MTENYTVQDVVNHSIEGDVADLEKAFDGVMRQKINQALETRKQEIGQRFGETEEDE